MKFGFVTCVQIGLSCMEAIYEIGGTLDLVISIPDDHARKKSGRIYVDPFADKHRIPKLKTRHINDADTIETIKKREIDWLFIIGWSQIASKAAIGSARLGAIGAHPTLLPVGRGRAAIPWAIIKGLDKTGVTFFKMDEGVDTGLILGQEEIPIVNNETATTLYDKVNLAHATLIKRLYQQLESNQVEGRKQDESKATVWPGRKPEDGRIDHGFSMEETDRLVRATTRPYPGAFLMQDGKKIIIWSGRKSVSKIQDSSLFEIQLNDGFYYADEFQLETEL